MVETEPLGARALGRREQEIVTAIIERRDDLIELARALIRFDTQTHPIEDPRQEVQLQEFLGERFRAAGLAVDVWEPEPGSVPTDRLGLSSTFHFRGRPQLLARLAGAGGGRSLLFNGHIDTVTVEPRGRWSVDPLAGKVRADRLYGRGACDMKGGVAATVIATEMLRQLDVELNGDLLVNTVTGEESTAAGTRASVLRGEREQMVASSPSRRDCRPGWVREGVSCRR